MARQPDSAERASLRRVLFFGWGAAAEAVLTELKEGLAADGECEVFCVSHPSQAEDAPLDAACARLGFRCLLSDGEAEVHSAAAAFAPEVIISASYRKRISSELLGLCTDAINFHPSLLPKHRGCMSSFWAILEGDQATGVTCHRMVEEFDAGLILHQETLAIAEDDTSKSLYQKLVPVTAVCARHVVRLLRAGRLPVGEEQMGPASYHYRKLPYSGLVDPSWPDEKVSRFIRAMHFPPFDGAAVEVGGRRILVSSVQHCRQVLASSVALAPQVASENVGEAEEGKGALLAAAGGVPAPLPGPGAS